jgi:molybdenum cofactor biosynthesis enzyme MoaA
VINNDKNRVRDPYSFANINLLGRCNAHCFFCLGRDIGEHIDKFDQTKTPFQEWANFYDFERRCQAEGIKKIYVTGQNTDSLLYKHLDDLVGHLHAVGFQVGLRTNGYEAMAHLGVINKCELSTGYSIHSLDPVTTKMILGRGDMPDWERIIPATERPRVSIVLNRCNEGQFYDLLRYIAKFPNVRYIQVRRPSTDTRLALLAPDMAAYERVYTQTKAIFPLKSKFAGDAEVYEIYGKDVVFWRTIKTTVNSINYFTDGTISDLYFIVEGYLRYRAGGNKPQEGKQ